MALENPFKSDSQKPSLTKTMTQFTSAQILFQQGKQARRNGDIVTAIACFQETIRLQADFVPAYNNLGNLLQAQGQIDEALSNYQQALALAPEMAVLHCNQASLLQIHGELERAIAGYEKALSLKPDFLLAQHNLGKLLAAQGQLAKATEAYQQALRLKPDANDSDIRTATRANPSAIPGLSGHDGRGFYPVYFGGYDNYSAGIGPTLPRASRLSAPCLGCGTDGDC
jgi:tetratricopeptide (TPR) repeat protein